MRTHARESSPLGMGPARSTPTVPAASGRAVIATNATRDRTPARARPRARRARRRGRRSRRDVRPRHRHNRAAVRLCFHGGGFEPSECVDVRRR